MTCRSGSAASSLRDAKRPSAFDLLEVSSTECGFISAALYREKPSYRGWMTSAQGPDTSLYLPTTFLGFPAWGFPINCKVRLYRALKGHLGKKPFFGSSRNLVLTDGRIRWKRKLKLLCCLWLIGWYKEIQG